MSLAAKVKSVSQETRTCTTDRFLIYGIFDVLRLLCAIKFRIDSNFFVHHESASDISTDGLLYVLSYTLCNSNLLIDKNWYQVSLYIRSKIFGKCGQYLLFYVLGMDGKLCNISDMY